MFVAFLLTYWRPIAVIAALFGAWVSGDMHGHASEKAYYVAQISQIKDDAEKQQKLLQDKVNLWATAYESERAKSSKILEDAIKGAHNEYAKNPDYARCHVGADFLRAYRSVATGTAIVAEPSK